MADFLGSVWESIFTPGPTPPLLLATNVAFFSLQLVLALLLFFTYSIHFLVLSALCGGLWWSINWFAGEVMIVQKEKEEEERRMLETEEREGKSVRAKASRDDVREGLVDSAMDSGDDTETETDDAGSRSLRSSQTDRADSASGGGPTLVSPQKSGNTIAGQSEGTSSGFNTNIAASLAPLAKPNDAIRQRKSLAESTGDLSTDSEWEKVDDER